MKIKPLDESIENYVLSAAQGMWKFRRYLKKKGAKDSTDKAINYGVKMVLAGTSDLNKAKTMFLDLSEASESLALALERLQKESK